MRFFYYRTTAGVFLNNENFSPIQLGFPAHPLNFGYSSQECGVDQIVSGIMAEHLSGSNRTLDE